MSESGVDGALKKRKLDEDAETSETKKVKAEEEEEEGDARPAFGMGGGLANSDAPDESPSSATPSLGIGAKLLRLAGYSGAGGLGKRGSGIAEPVAASTQLSTEGLGFQGAVKRQTHSFEAFKVEIELRPAWLISRDETGSLPSASDMSSWLREGPRDPSQISDDHFCSGEVQTQLLSAKSAFDDVPSSLFRSARERSNPFERIRGEFFQNRAALKMAEMDAMCGRIFTAPPLVRAARKRELVYIGDVAAGPGGFSEFILTVLKWRAVVCGFTLRAGASDFQTHKFNRNAPTHSFHAFYGSDDTGDITKSENVRDYREKVMALTHGRGLHVVMADGGFSVVGRENLQEYLSRQLVLCQFLTALATLQKGGVFVCKLFDSFLPFTVDLLFILRQHFTHFSLIKPNQSRPANSERYVVAHGLKQFQPAVVEYLFAANDRINLLKRSHRSQLGDIVNIDFAASRDEATKRRDRRINAGMQSGLGSGATTARFKSAGRLDGTAEPDPNADRGDGKDMFGRDIVPQVKEEGSSTDAMPADAGAGATTDAAAASSSAPAAAAASSSSTAHPTERDILGLVPEHIVSADRDFCSYMRYQNETIARRQIFTLHRLKQYVEDPALPPDDQEAVREECLKFWGLSQEEMPPMPPVDTLLPRIPREQRRGRSRDRRSGSDRSDHSGSSDRRRRRRHRRSHRSRHRSSGSRSRSRSHSRSRSSSHSRSSSRSPSRTPSPSRSPSPVAASSAQTKKLYVHYDPLWQTRLFDPSFPSNARSIFWTSASARRMVQYHVPDDIKQARPLLPLPSESERAQLRIHAEQYPQDPPDPRMTQLDTIARAARSWYILPVPAGGIRHTVWFSLSGMGHIDSTGKPLAWTMSPRMRVPADTLLDVVWVGGVMHVLDALALPTPSDLAAYRSRSRLLERRELVDMFVESCNESRLRTVTPIPLMEWKRSALARSPTTPDVDLFLLRDGFRAPANPSYAWTAADEERMTFDEVNAMLLYIASKQAPIAAAPVPMPRP